MTTLDQQEQVSVILKEYDCLLKEIDEKTNTFQIRGLPVIVVIAGALIGWHGNIPPDWLLLFAPVCIAVLADVSISAWYYMDRAGRWLALVEDKIFVVTGVPLLTHQTTLALSRHRGFRVWGWLVYAITMPLLYCGWEIRMYQINPIFSASVSRHSGSKGILLAFILTPAARLSLGCAKLFWLRRTAFSTSLSKSIDDHK